MTITELWLPIKGFEGFYEISSLGNIRSQSRDVFKKGNKRSGYRIIKCRVKGKKLNPTTKKNGYTEINLNKRTKATYHLVHRLVAEAFLPNPQTKPHINHKDGNKINNKVENLEWCTAKENMYHASKNNLINKGTNSPISKLTEEEVLEIRTKYKRYVYGSPKLALEYGVSKSTMYEVITGKTWQHVVTT